MSIQSKLFLPPSNFGPVTFDSESQQGGPGLDIVFSHFLQSNTQIQARPVSPSQSADLLPSSTARRTLDESLRSLPGVR